jgi:hypothetical protein
MALPPTLGPDGRPTPTTLFLTIHHALRRDAHRFPVALRAGGDLAAAEAHWPWYRAVLVEHHETEDERLFPGVLAAFPDLAPTVEQLAAEHLVVDELLADIDTAFADLAARVDTCAALCERLADVLDRHLDREEEWLVPLMARGAVAGPPGGGPEVGIDEPESQLPWLVDGVDPAVVEGLLAVLPPDLRAGFPAWRDAYGSGPLAGAARPAA